MKYLETDGAKLMRLPERQGICIVSLPSNALINGVNAGNEQCGLSRRTRQSTGLGQPISVLDLEYQPASGGDYGE